jgi:predicted transcriptional regulator
MATNLRLKPETEAALREESERTGRSQQELIREALDQYLGLTEKRQPYRTSIDDMIARGELIPPREPYRRAERLMKLPEGVTSLDLLDREDRF